MHTHTEAQAGFQSTRARRKVEEGSAQEVVQTPDWDPTTPIREESLSCKALGRSFPTKWNSKCRALGHDGTQCILVTGLECAGQPGWRRGRRVGRERSEGRGHQRDSRGLSFCRGG